MTRGFVTIATGDALYYQLAGNLLASYKLYTDSPYPFAILCDRKNEITEQFDDVVIFPDAKRNYFDKFELLIRAPYDETIFIDGYPGKYCVLARRHGNTWYIAGNNATGETLKLKLSLPMLKKGDLAALYSDNIKDREPQLTELKVKNPQAVTITMADQGGFVIVTK